MKETGSGRPEGRKPKPFSIGRTERGWMASVKIPGTTYRRSLEIDNSHPDFRVITGTALNLETGEATIVGRKLHPKNGIIKKKNK